ncbi:hypothetical protein HZH68_011096 [Vespula germanica]|uniref:Uncharacterized protein n=1 Tax=Vespula germanica TaxID=30212 RepID=A0A834JMX8_VESGE|nr:hypothetical protein HZH68_011096 [Vespula germanica]
MEKTAFTLEAREMARHGIEGGDEGGGIGDGGGRRERGREGEGERGGRQEAIRANIGTLPLVVARGSGNDNAVGRVHATATNYFQVGVPALFPIRYCYGNLLQDAVGT